MAYLTTDQLADGNQSNTLAPGETATVILTEYAPFTSKKGVTIPKHLAKNTDTGAELEFVGFKFHDAVKPLNDQIIPGITALKVMCLDNSTQYPDYEVSVAALGATEEAPF